MKISTATIFTIVIIIAGFCFVRSQQLTKKSRRVIRIANGEQVDQYYYAYIVGVKINNSIDIINYCTGSLVSSLFVLTAAHCIEGSITTEVYRNDPRNLIGEKRNVVEFFIHPLFNITSLVADLCLLKINKKFEHISNYAVISRNTDIFTNLTTLECTIVGWGKNKLSYPKYKANVASVRVKYGPEACEVPPDNIFIKNIVEDTWDEFLCPVPDNRMVCVGDSGGALVCQGLVYGITSHGYNYYPGMNGLQTKCGDNRVQTRHIFVCKYRQWIEDIIIYGTSNTLKCNYLFVAFIFWSSIYATEILI